MLNVVRLDIIQQAEKEFDDHGDDDEYDEGHDDSANDDDGDDNDR